MPDTLNNSAHRLPVACERLGGIHERTLHRMIRSGQIVAHKIGGRTVILQSTIDAYLDTLPTRGTDDEVA